MARKGLPKKYAKMGFKKGWKAYKKTQGKTSAPRRRRARATPKRTNKNRRVRKTKTNKLMTKTFVDGLISGGGKVVMRKVLGSNLIYEAGFDIVLGYFRNNKTLLGQGIVNGATAFLPSLGLVGGTPQESWIGQ